MKTWLKGQNPGYDSGLSGFIRVYPGYDSGLSGFIRVYPGYD